MPLIPIHINQTTFQVDSMDPADSATDIALELGEQMDLDTLQFIQLEETLKLVLGQDISAHTSFSLDMDRDISLPFLRNPSAPALELSSPVMARMGHHAISPVPPPAPLDLGQLDDVATLGDSSASAPQQKLNTINRDYTNALNADDGNIRENPLLAIKFLDAIQLIAENPGLDTSSLHKDLHHLLDAIKSAKTGYDE